MAMTVIHEISHFEGTKDFPRSANDGRPDPKLYFPAHPVLQDVDGYVNDLREHSESHLIITKTTKDLLNNADSLTAFSLDLAVSTTLTDTDTPNLIEIINSLNTELYQGNTSNSEKEYETQHATQSSHRQMSLKRSIYRK
ncbi:hypothetical protein [Serratia sp. FS14]|uniref:hypothetical protein n=1 Tax=Serratia sp. (strain FS14) TaxID=1327989 RepID=UPI001185777E|nr:hypothetical protein [Serratia sp. FS14]